MARPTVLTDELIAELVAKIRTYGGNIETALQVSPINRATYYRWVRAVNEGRGTKLQRRLVAEVRQAEGEIKGTCEALVLLAGQKHWQAAAWMLERKYPNEYGRRVAVLPPAEPLPNEREQRKPNIVEEALASGDPELVDKLEEVYLSVRSRRSVESDSGSNGGTSEQGAMGSG